MAEKYGTIPKTFTKEWWEHFWTYYKWYAIVPLLIIVAVVFTIISATPPYDTVLSYAGSGIYTTEEAQKIEEALSPFCTDIDDNGKKLLSFNQYTFTGNIENAEYENALRNKLFIALSEDENFVFIMDKETADIYAGDSEVGSMFAPLDDWFEGEYKGDNVYSANGVNYGIAVKDSPILKELGLDYGERYLFIRFYPRRDQLKKFLPGYEGAIEFANKLYKK